MKYNVYNQRGNLIGDGVNLRMAVAKILTDYPGDWYEIKKSKTGLYYLQVEQEYFGVFPFLFKSRVAKTKEYPCEQMLLEHVLRINYRGCWVEEVNE